MSGRVIVVGNSFIGAMVVALGKEPALAGGYRFDFAGSAGGSFADIRLESGRLVNTMASDRFEVGHIDEYDAAFVYSDFHSAHLVARTRRSLEKRRYSNQVIDVALLDMLESSNALPIYRQLKAAARGPVGILSGNAGSDFGPISEEEYRQGVAVLQRVVGEDYVETPREMFTPDFRPDEALYKGSVDIHGEGLGNGRQARHDVSHLNEKGGKIVLAGLVGRLRALDVDVQSDDNGVRRAAL